MKDYSLPAGYVLVLRTCNSDMTAYGGFVWPDFGPVEAPDWIADGKCVHGLHGLLWGEGSGGYLDWSERAKWLIVEVEAASVVSINGDKVKFPRGNVIVAGTKNEAIEFLAAHIDDPQRRYVCGTATAGDRGTATAGYSGTATAGDRGTATAGDRGTATAGDSGTATAGDRGTATAGDRGTATAGDSGTATAGYRGTATAGYRGTATAGYRGTATAGDRGTATAGYRGTATAGDRGTATAGDRGTATARYSGTATAGDRGTATAGDRGTATAGYRGTATAGYRGTVAIKWWDESKQRYRVAIGYVGDDGLMPGTAYVVTHGKLVMKDS
jgi:hypothetical protein